MNVKLAAGISHDSLDDELLNPFVHHLELETTYEKIKTAILTVVLLPIRVSIICLLLIAGWFLACIGLWGVTEEDLRSKPISGWRSTFRRISAKIIWFMFVAGGFHLRVIGKQSDRKAAPVVALAPHSSFMDSLAMVYMGGPSIVAKGETASIPFFGSRSRLLRELQDFKGEPSGAVFLNYLRNGSTDLNEILRKLVSNEYTSTMKLTPLLCFLGKMVYRIGGMQLVVKGKQACRKEAPILVTAPHSTFLDGGIIYATGFPSIIVRRESGMNPYMGKLINFTQPVYVWRDDSDSRQNTIKEIISRAKSDQDWPQILIFPEGTCTNRSCLITFKPGAFYPGVPIQPVCIRYPNKLDTVTWTWEGPSALTLLWLTLTQPYSSCEIEFLPVYTPNEEEKRDPKLFANNVRAVMAKALGVPVSDYTYGDCKIMAKAKEMNLPNSTSLVEVQKLRNRLDLHNMNVEENLLNSNIVLNNCGIINYPEFCKLLNVSPDDHASQHLFKLYDKQHTGTIDFREYLLGVLALSNSRTTLDSVKLACKIFDCSGSGKLGLEDFSKAVYHTLAISREYATEIFEQVDKNKLGYVTFDNFLAYASKKAEFTQLFSINNEKDFTNRNGEICPNDYSKKTD